MSARERPVLRLARPDEADRVVGFVNKNFDRALPLVNIPEYFDYYYRFDGALHFALAEQGGEILAAAGYIPSNRSAEPDVWVSVLVAAAGHNGVGLSLMDALPALTGARVVSCNNIRPKTMPLYRFLGWYAGRLPHFYRLGGRGGHRLARVADPVILPAGGDLALREVKSAAQLRELGLPPSSRTPRKDLWYLERRYFGFPGFRYDVYAAGDGGAPAAYLVARTVDTDPLHPESNVRVLRIVDFVGEDEVLPSIGGAIDRLLHQSRAEYADCYCFGIGAETFAAAGFCERREGDGSVIPNYLTPPLRENTEYYFFTNRPDGFVMFKADGDQDRPNLYAD